MKQPGVLKGPCEYATLPAPTSWPRHYLGVTERRFYQLTKRREAPAVQLWGVADGQPEGDNGGFFMAGQGYSGSDVADVVEWLHERANGYPPRTLAMRVVNGYHPCSDEDGATWMRDRYTGTA